MSRNNLIVARPVLFGFVAALALSIAGLGVLGYFVWDLHREATVAHRDLADLQAAHEEVDSEVTTATSDIDSLEGDLDAIERSLGDLVELTGGFPQFTDLAELASAAVSDVQTLQRNLDSLRTCFNDALSDSFASFESWVENPYVLSYFVSEC
jgi:hypothetical protein